VKTGIAFPRLIAIHHGSVILALTEIGLESPLF